MISIESYVRRGRHTLRRWAVDPRIHILTRAAAYIFAGFFLSAAGLLHHCLPLPAALVCACTGWGGVLAAIGGGLGYWAFWGSSITQPLVWLGLSLGISLILTRRRISRQTPLLIPASAALLVAATGVVFQVSVGQMAPVEVYLLRVVLAFGVSWLFMQVLSGRNPILDWLVCGVGVLALANVMPIPYLGFGYVAAGMLGVVGTFPAASLAGLALDLAQVTPVPMTAVLCLSFLLRLLPRQRRALARLVPAAMYLLVMHLAGYKDWYPLPGLLLGGIAGSFLPTPVATAHRRGETGVAQVRLEMAAGALAQTEQLLLEAPMVSVDEDALVSRAAERACGGCPCRKNCRDSGRIVQLSGLLLRKPLLTTEELPIICRKSGRFLAELHRSQEQLRSIQADRQRQKEYRAAVIQQYQFLATYLQDLSDALAHRGNTQKSGYCPQVAVYGNRLQEENGDRWSRFAGTQSRYYVLLCDGMGTGLGAAQEAKTAAVLLRRLLCAGYPAAHALRSLNSLCALRDRAGAVTVDLAELELDTGKATLYKWGAAASYLVSRNAAEKIGTAGPPPGLSVTDCQEFSQRLSLRRGETLLLVSDGIAEEDALRCCLRGAGLSAGELATRLVASAQTVGEDDATVVTVQLVSSLED